MRSLPVICALFALLALCACGSEESLTPPVITVVSAVGSLGTTEALTSPSQDPSIVVTGTIDNAASTIKVTVSPDAATIENVVQSGTDWSFTLIPTEGTNVVSVVASDTHGNLNRMYLPLVHDETAPKIVSLVRSNDNAAQLRLVFNEKLDTASAENVAAYSIAGAEITAAALDSGEGGTFRIVTLTLSEALAAGSYSVTAAGILDLSLPNGNATDPGYTFDFTLL